MIAIGELVGAIIFLIVLIALADAHGQPKSKYRIKD